ncbi:UDP-N-acetylgalactosamine-undecaprenyl-phosphate N-acetylgalactosaminephosphotransferase [Trichinella spiralis]|uniref:UDP-N-acetylgalactosamine-undecaprenyl-phosphate N-acetylgalactosaminephosphotransferase n=1 Tax=Trichinella spiralis TaxID=6334 RepID=A0ABR3L1L7_TRISP
MRQVLFSEKIETFCVRFAIVVSEERNQPISIMAVMRRVTLEYACHSGDIGKTCGLFIWPIFHDLLLQSCSAWLAVCWPTLWRGFHQFFKKERVDEPGAQFIAGSVRKNVFRVNRGVIGSRFFTCWLAVLSYAGQKMLPLINAAYHSFTGSVQSSHKRIDPPLKALDTGDELGNQLHFNRFEKLFTLPLFPPFSILLQICQTSKHHLNNFIFAWLLNCMLFKLIRQQATLKAKLLKVILNDNSCKLSIFLKQVLSYHILKKHLA